MNTAAALTATRAAATDHGRPLVHFGGVPLVDVRNDFPSYQVGRTMAPRDPALIQFVSHHHDAAFYPVDAEPADDFHREMERLRIVYHVHRANGWGGIGYHTYGFPSGRLYLVGDYGTQRANVAGRNHQSIGHCSAGLFTDAPPPIATQLVAALATVAAWAYAGRMLAAPSHHDAALPSDPTECCGATRDQWVPRLSIAVERIIRDRRT